MSNTHRCSECGHEAAGHEAGHCSFGPNKGHIHIYYRIDWNDAPAPTFPVGSSSRMAEVALQNATRSPCTGYARHTGSCSRGTRGCGSHHGR